ncbi:DUF3332 family protein [Candidatus Sumerlaeota bacterium]|nr:DUF3332 family protein [Candidatus Sumerlaeota bacterium]
MSTATHRSALMRSIGTVLLVAFTISSFACFGQFPLTHMVYEVNGDITDNELGQSIIMWVFLILPVYWFAMLGDALIFNLIEFWTGEAPIQAGVVQSDGLYETAMTVSEDGTTMTMTLSREGSVISEVTSVEIAPGLYEMRDADGLVVGLVQRTAEGNLDLCDAEGNVLRTITADQIAAAQAG